MQTILRVCGTAILGFMFPRILVGTGVPLDKWAIEIGIKIAGARAMMSGDQVLSILGILVALLFMTVELWLTPIGRIIEAVKRNLPFGRELGLVQVNVSIPLTPLLFEYDTPIWKACEYISALIKESRTGYDLPKTRSLIRQKAIDGHLKIWGKRQLDGGQEWVDTRKFDDVVTEIHKQYWDISKISAYATTDNEHVNNFYTLPLYPGAWPNKNNAYADLRVNLGQVKQIWPR